MKALQKLVLLMSLASSLLISGCGTTFENRVACDPSMTEMTFISKYGHFGVSADIKAEDGETACQAILLYNVMQKAAGK